MNFELEPIGRDLTILGSAYFLSSDPLFFTLAVSLNGTAPFSSSRPDAYDSAERRG